MLRRIYNYALLTIKSPREGWSRLEDKLLRRILPKDRYFKWCWSYAHSSTWWFKNAPQVEDAEGIREEYRDFIYSIRKVLKQNNSLGIDLGCGVFRLTKYLLKYFPDSHYLGVDFSDFAVSAYNQIKGLGNIDFVNADITLTERWIPYVNGHYDNYSIVVFTYGVYTYLSANNLIRLFNCLHQLEGLQRIVSIEPTGELDLDSIQTVERNSYFHNYSMYLERAGFQLENYRYLTEKHDNIFIDAVPTQVSLKSW